MKRLLRSSVLLAACVGFLSCTNDPTGDLGGTPTKLAATPGSLFIEQDATELVDIEVLDEQGGAVPASFSVAVLTPGIDVTVDDEFRPEYNADGVLFVPDEVTKLRLNVTGTSLVESTIRVTSGDLSLDIPVKVIPHDLDVVFSPATPAPGDTVTMTLPPELALSPTSAVTFPGNLNPIIIDRAVDSSSLRFIAAPTTDIEATVTLVNNRVFPQLAPITLTTGSKLTSTTAGLLGEFLPGTVSDITPGAAPITITLDPVFRFKAATTVNFAAGQPAPIIQSQSADSQVITMLVGPNVNSPARVDSILFNGAPQFKYRRFTQDTLVSPVVTSVPVTFGDATPDFGQDVVVTADDGFIFGAGTTVKLNGITLPVVARAGDGSTITVRNYPGGPNTGPLTVTTAIAPTAPLFPLILPTDDNITLGQMVLAGSGGTLVVADTGTYESTVFGFPTRLYTTTLAAPATVDVTVTYTGAHDLGLYILDEAGDIVDAADSFGSSGGGGGNGQPEIVNNVALPAGTYRFAMLTFGPGPANYTMSIHTD